ncbi:MAG: peptide chain release factor 3 [Chthonomonadales bacterium]
MPTLSEAPVRDLTEAARRRTFAIISHPDAGKTTLTEKLLLYADAIDLAGAVKAKKNQRSATSDWMELERQRGISITSTVLQFEYDGRMINLLDTPGHQDFSEDTYRTLAAADSAVMLMDAAKGVETQTRKLFAVCRKRAIPIFTFYNKMDRPGREPLELLGEIEDVLGVAAYPVNWPLGMGETFVGVYNRITKEVHQFERVEHGRNRAPVQVSGIDDPRLKALTDERTYNQFREEIELLDLAGEQFDEELFRAGELTPVYFGSARTNFGVQLFFDDFIVRAPSPMDALHEFSRPQDEFDASETAQFTGFVFKIQANMDPQHRDCVAFMRVRSGKFERDMTVLHIRSGKKVRLSRAMRLFAQERTSVEVAYAGDIVGLSNPGLFAIGDGLCEGKPVAMEPIPRFPPERFASLRCPDPSKRKSFIKGLEQLSQEGAIQIFYGRNEARDPVLAVVGELQFEVATYRLKAEYNVDTIMERLSYTLARWLDGPEADITTLVRLSALRAMEDRGGRPVALFEAEWSLKFVTEKYPNVTFSEMGPSS